MIDLFTSRRECFEKCMYWHRNPNEDIDNDELVMSRKPSGIFYAKEITPHTVTNNIVAGSFMFDSSSIVLKTYDSITDIKNNCLVKYQDEVWIVEDVQKQHIRNKNSEFAKEKDTSHAYIIRMRKR